MDLPRELGEFVIVHELVYRLANYGKVFKSFVHAYPTEWEEMDQKIDGIRSS